ncbi:MAG: protein kinase [bacterium]
MTRTFAATASRGGAVVVRGPGIRTQIFVACALLVLFTLATSIAFATWRANVVAERTIRAALAKVPALFGVYRTSVEDQLVQWLRAVSEEPGTRALFVATDAETRTEWARDLAALHQARTVFLFDRDGALLARSDRAPGSGEGSSFAGVRWVAEPLVARHPVAAAIREKDVLSIVAAVPVLSGQGDSAVLNGVLAATSGLDAARAGEVQALTGGEVAFVADVARRGEAPRPLLSATTAGFRAAEFESVLAGMRERGAELLTRQADGLALDLVVAGESRLVTSVPIESASAELLGACVVSRSRADETAAFREIRDSLVALGGLALVLALPLSFVVGRGLAKPIEQLAAGASAIRDGRLDVELPEDGTGEVGALAVAFRGMVAELREKAALEALVAELRQHGDPRSRPDAPAAAAAGTGDARMPAVGRRFAERYEIEACLGSGGMGSVFRARDRELDDDVALKVLLPEAFPAGDLAAETLRREIRLARKITHPNVVRTHDLGEWGGMRFLTMEYVPGTTLREMLDRLGALALGPGLQIAKQLCRGLAAVHEAGIVHRDLKPQNVMVLPNGLVKLMDFGISRVLEGNDSVADGSIVGTPAYMSPEQARGEAVDGRADLYAVGVVLFEMFAGRKPLQGATAMETLALAASRPAPRLRAFRPELPTVLDALVAACLAKRVDERPASAIELHQELRGVAA